MTRPLALLLVLALALPAGAALAQREPPRREPPPTTQPRPERIVPPPQAPLSPDHNARPDIRAGIDQLPVGESRVRITVKVIAAEPGAGAAAKDPRLSSVESNLDTLPLRYGSYKLLDERTFDLDWKSGGQMELPGSRSLLVTPRNIGSDGRIRVHLEVLGAHPEHSRKLHTDYSIARGGTLLVGGYRLDPVKPEAGTLLIAITQVISR